MKGFYISKLIVSGVELPDSTIEFKDGVNIIYGPSNTGKSYVIRCIDYLFGSDNSPIGEESGYNTIEIHICGRAGGTCVIRRKLNEKKVTVLSSSIGSIEDGEYKTTSDEFKQIYLKLIGIKDRITLVAKQDYTRTQKLSWRMLGPIFLIQEEYIFRSDSIVTTPGFKNITVALSALKYCYDGLQVDIPDLKDENAAAIGRKAVISYISKQIQQLKDEKLQLEETLATWGDVNIEEGLLEQTKKLEQLNQESQDLANRSKELLRSRLKLSDQLQELLYLQERFMALSAGYKSDIKRLSFIIEGEDVRPEGPQNITCPICSNEMRKREHKSLADSAQKELLEIKKQLKELSSLLSSNDTEIESQGEKLRVVTEEQASLRRLIDETYKKQVQEVQTNISALGKLQQMKARSGYIQEIIEGLDTDMKNFETGKEILLTYDVKCMLGDAFYTYINQYLEEILRSCKYDNFMSCHLSKSEFDIVIDGKKKRNQGKGYRAFLNTILAYSILKLLSVYGTYSPGMLILDSPVLSLKEKNEQTSAEMKENLFKQILRTEFPCQIIIVENDIPNIDYSTANMIHFTKDSATGRYGFFKEVRYGSEYKL